MEGISVLTDIDWSCPICLEVCDSKTLSHLDSCSHSLCESCFKDLIRFSNKCPLCTKIFSSCTNKEGHVKMSEYKITETELTNISNETFECFSKQQIIRELKHYKQLAENIKINLFTKRSCNGSHKEFALYEEIIERVDNSNTLIKYEPFETKPIMINLDLIIQGIKNLQNRTYQNDNLYEQEEILYYDENDKLGANYNCSITIEYVDRKKSGPKKKKKR